MPRTVWDSKQKKREQKKEKVWKRLYDKNSQITLDDIAEQVDRSKQQLYSYIHGKAEPTFGVMAKWFATAKLSNEEIVDAVKAWQ